MKLERWGDWAADYAGATVVEPFSDVANFVITDSAHVAESWDTGYSPEFGEAAKLGLLGDDTEYEVLPVLSLDRPHLDVLDDRGPVIRIDNRLADSESHMSGTPS